MKKIILILLPILFMFSTCALEIANVIGPGGGWVFYDKGNYEDPEGWRYIQCGSNDLGKFVYDGTNDNDLLSFANTKCIDHSGGWYKFEWEMPSPEHLRKMLECFSYGLSNFKPDNHYLALRKIYECDDCGKEKELEFLKTLTVPVYLCDGEEDIVKGIPKGCSTGPKDVKTFNFVRTENVIYHLDYTETAFGKPTIVDDYKGEVRIRAILRF